MRAVIGVDQVVFCKEDAEVVGERFECVVC